MMMRKIALVVMMTAVMFVFVPYAGADAAESKEEIINRVHGEMFGRGTKATQFWIDHWPNGGEVELRRIFNSNTSYRSAIIGNVYYTYLERDPRQDETDFYIKHQTDLKRIGNYLSQSKERRGNVNKLYKHYLGRELSDTEWGDRVRRAKEGKARTIWELERELVASKERQDKVTDLFREKYDRMPNTIEHDVLFKYSIPEKKNNKSIASIRKFLNGEKYLELRASDQDGDIDGYVHDNECMVFAFINYGTTDVDVRGFKLKSGDHVASLSSFPTYVHPYRQMTIGPKEYFKYDYTDGKAPHKCNLKLNHYGLNVTAEEYNDDFRKIRERYYANEEVYLIDGNGVELSNLHLPRASDFNY
ncbi:hypothetical protein KKC60_03750 [Patescibacteria group bacterium]|nr:hypothetical protein [Patescibacteria group bacterium]